MNLKTNLKRYLEILDWSVAQMARKASCPKSSLQSWMNGSKSVKNAEYLKRVAETLSQHIPGGVTVDDLLFGNAENRKNGKSPEAMFDGLADTDGWISGCWEVRLRPLRRGRHD
jgi:transcriptional regulator with XRE-family HTH domain